MSEVQARKVYALGFSLETWSCFRRGFVNLDGADFLLYFPVLRHYMHVRFADDAGTTAHIALKLTRATYWNQHQISTPVYSWFYLPYKHLNYAWVTHIVNFQSQDKREMNTVYGVEAGNVCLVTVSFALVGSQISPRRAKKDSNIPSRGRTRSVKCPTPGPTKTIKSPPHAPPWLYIDRCITTKKNRFWQPSELLSHSVWQEIWNFQEIRAKKKQNKTKQNKNNKTKFFWE